MKAYYDRDSAPLAFHSFIRYVSLPLGFLVTLGQMLLEFSGASAYNWLYSADLLASITTLALIATCFVGFRGWKSYAWYGMMIYLGFGVLYNVFVISVYSTYAPQMVDSAVSRCMGSLIYAILVGVYYYKRKPLFFEQLPPSLPDTPANEVGSNPIAEPPAPCDSPILFCRKCGAKLLPESEFCNQCGTKIIKESQK